MGLAPDFSYVKPQADSHVMFIHRHLADGEAYFVANRLDRAETITGSFRVTGRLPELWDPATGLSRPASYRIEGDRTEVTLPFDRFGSLFVVFRQPAVESAHVEHTPRWQALTTLSGPWPVAFQTGRGAPAHVVFDQLADFRENRDPGIRYFSGIATYTKDLSVTRRDVAGGRHLWLDLGQVDDLAEVWVNGQLAGITWKPPYRLDISSRLEPGHNKLEVRVVNLWVNRLIGDVQPANPIKITFTQADGKVGPDTPPAEAANQLRMPYAADAPLRPSGLIGPVTLLAEDEQ
jgi:hypothetical protein